MELKVDQEFKDICREIKGESKTEDDWALIESSDMFQSENYNGGFDATEMEFCFSYYDQTQKEYWFQMSLEQVKKVLTGEHLTLDMREAEL